MKNRICCITLALSVMMVAACTNAEVTGSVTNTGSDGSVTGNVNITAEVENNDEILVDNIKNTDTAYVDTKQNKVDDAGSKEKQSDSSSSKETSSGNSGDTKINEDEISVADNSDSGSVEPGNFENDSETKVPSLDDYVITAVHGEMVVVKNAVVRKGPSTDFDKIGTLAIGDVVELTGESDNGWYRFKFDSFEGYTFQKFFVDKEIYDREKEEEAKESDNESVDLKEDANSKEPDIADNQDTDDSNPDDTQNAEESEEDKDLGKLPEEQTLVQLNTE